jgi:hypothetical protein
VLIRKIRITQTEVVAQVSLRQTCLRSRHRPAATASAEGLADAMPESVPGVRSTSERERRAETDRKHAVQRTCERRDASVSRETASEGPSPAQLTELRLLYT